MDRNTLITQIQDTLTKIGQLEAVNRQYKIADKEEQRLIKALNKLEIRISKELKDITDLEKLGVKSIFAKVLGNKEQQLEKERQEYLQVTLQHKEMMNSLEVASFEKEVLEKKLGKLDEYKNKLKSLKKARSQQIMLSPGPLRNELRTLYSKIDKLKKMDIEIDEAQKAGQRALNNISLIEAHFKKAKEWGNWDMMNKGGYYKMMKNSAIDKAFREIARSRLVLNNFNAELADVGYRQHTFALRVDSINQFPTMIFDNMITDWIVQSKIKSVLSSVSGLIDDIKLMMQTLEADSQKNLIEHDRLNQRISDLLEQ